MICSHTAGTHKAGHNICVTRIIKSIRKEFSPKACPTITTLTGVDDNKQPDIYTEKDDQTFDLTIVTNAQEGYSRKIRKYGPTALQKTVIPIVIEYKLDMH